MIFFLFFLAPPKKYEVIINKKQTIKAFPAHDYVVNKNCSYNYFNRADRNGERIENGSAF